VIVRRKPAAEMPTREFAMRNPSDQDQDDQDAGSERARQAPTADSSRQVPESDRAEAPQSGDDLQSHPIIINR